MCTLFSFGMCQSIISSSKLFFYVPCEHFVFVYEGCPEMFKTVCLFSSNMMALREKTCLFITSAFKINKNNLLQRYREYYILLCLQGMGTRSRNIIQMWKIIESYVSCFRAPSGKLLEIVYLSCTFQYGKPINNFSSC